MSVYDISDVAAANEHPDRNRRFAERVLTRVDRHHSFTWEQVASFSKWLTASLLAVNGAGGLTAVGLLKDGGGPWSPSILFGLGLLMALLSGTALQHFYDAVTAPILEQDNYWTTVSIDGVRDGELEEQLEAKITRALRFAYVAPVLGWCSGISFIAGSVALAMSSASAGASSKSVCLKLQRDMLSEKPQRSNAHEIYSALGCKPKT